MRLVIGRTRYGKSFSVVEWLRHQEGKVVVCDPQNSLSYEYLKQIARFDLNIVVDSIHRVDRAIAMLNIQRCTRENKLEEERDNDAYRRLFRDFIYGRAALNETENRLINEWCVVALRCIQFQKQPVPLFWMHYALKPAHHAFKLLYDGCIDEKARFQMDRLKKNQLRQQEILAGAAIRVLEQLCEDAHFIARCGEIDFLEMLDENDVLMCHGEGATDDAIEIILQAWIYKTIEYVRYRKQPVTLVIDEAANWNLLPPSLVRAIATEEKNGLELVLITQSLEKFDPDVRATILDNASYVECFRIGAKDTIEEIAATIGTRTLDPERISHTEERTRQRNAGNYIEKIGDRDQLVNKYEEVKEKFDHRMPLSEQLLEFKSQLPNLQKQERMVADHEGVRMTRVPELTSGYAWPGIAEAYADERLEQMENSKWFHDTSGRMLEPPALEPEQKSTGGSGMKKSSRRRKRTSVPQDTSSTNSRRKRGPTPGSKNSGKPKDSDT